MENVKSPVAWGRDCRAAKEECISNKYWGQKQLATEEVMIIEKRVWGESGPLSGAALQDKHSDESDVTHREALKVTAGVGNRLGGCMINEACRP